MRLLEVLRPFASARKESAEAAHVRPHGPQLFSYCCFAAERLARVSNPRPVIGIVLSGTKEFWRGDAGQRFAAGDVFVFPAEVEVDAVNVPSEETGIYESLLLEVHSVPEAIRRLKVRGRLPAQGIDLRVPLTADLVEALGHAAMELSASDHATALAEHRLAEVLLLLRDVPAAACLYGVSLADRVGWLVIGEPARRWTAEQLGRTLGIGASTLRRRLAGRARRSGRSSPPPACGLRMRCCRRARVPSAMPPVPPAMCRGRISTGAFAPSTERRPARCGKQRRRGVPVGADGFAAR